jgi:DNA repair protein RadD
MKSTLRSDQHRALELLRCSLRSGKKRPLMQAPTGFGKTVVAAAIVEGVTKHSKSVIFTVPSISLIDQTIDRFASEGIHDVGVIQAQHVLTNSFAPVQIASIDTLCRRPLPKADFVLVDEAHRLHKFYGEWMTMDEWRNVPFIGLSATPWTKGLGRLYDDLIIPTTTSRLIDEGHLSKFRVFAPSHPDLTGVRTIAGDFHEGDLGEAMVKGSLVADIVTTWLARAENRPTMVFAVDCAHAKKIQAQFEAHGVMCGYIDAFTPRKDRNHLARQFGKGLQVVVNVGCLILGIDWDVRCLVLARPTKSEMLFTQIIGRALRTAAGKDYALILDHSDTHQRLGFVTDIMHTALNDGRPRLNEKSEVPLPKECPKCNYLMKPRAQFCPSCGFKPEIISKVKTANGELEEVDAVKHKADRETKQRWYSSLIQMQLDGGYKPGWVSNKFKQKFGVWPRGLSDRPMPPSPEVRSYVKAMNIRYAKGRAKQAEQQGGDHAGAR